MELHKVKLHLQQHFADGLVLIVGSGLSCAEGMPGMDNIAQHLCENVPNNMDINDHKEWGIISELIISEGLENALLKRPPSHSMERIIRKITAELFIEQELLVIKGVFSGERILRLTRLLPHLLKPSSGIPIVTTNYDRLIEIAVEEAGLGSDTMFAGHLMGTLNEKESRLSFCRNVAIKRRTARLEYRQRARIFKPHGSIDWYHRNEIPIRFAGILPEHIPLIITPGFNKFRGGYDSPFDLHRSCANDAIDHANRFLIIGYGFIDDHLQTHLIPGIKEGKPTLLMTHTLTPKALEIVNNNTNVIALSHEDRDGIEGTRLHYETKDYFYESCSLWDINNFVSEVLEP